MESKSDLSKSFRCLLCNSSNSGNLISAEVKNDNSGKLCVVDCGDCGHIQLNPPATSLAFYEDDGQVNNVICSYGTPFDTIIEHSWIEAKRRADRFASHGIPLNAQDSPIINMLDIGGGYGLFGSVMAERLPNSSVYVMEPSRARVEKGCQILAQKRNAVAPTFLNDLLDLKFVEKSRSRYNLVTMWHVLEHVENPIELLSNAYEILSPGGYLCIEVPNYNDELMQLSPSFRKRSFMMEHLSYFTPASLLRAGRTVANKAEVKVSGYQRYGIFNYFHWVYFDRPLGADPDMFEGVDRIWIEAAWRAGREAMLTSDALFMVVSKPAS